MPDEGKALRKSVPEQAAGFATPRLEQLLFACGGYVLAQLMVPIFVSDPGDRELLYSGITGAVIGVVAHVLIRGVGIQLPGVGKHFRLRASKDGRTVSKKIKPSSRSDRGSRYRAALAVFRRPFKQRNRNSERPGNEEKIVKTDEGFRVGDRVFSRRAEAEDYLYVGNPPAGEVEKRDQIATPETPRLRRISSPQARVLSSLALAFAIFLAWLLFFLI